MAFFRILALAAGAILVLFGLLFVGQGLGLILWPASSFMLARREWAFYGAVIVAMGIGLIWWSRRR